MNFNRINIAASCAMTALFCVAPAFASNTRSWVSSNGSDANPCTLSSPCLTFQHAHDMTLDSGEVDALTPGDFGTLLINRSITIDGGNMAYITVLGGQRGIDVEVTSTTSVVIIRNLSINNFNHAAAGTGAPQPNVGIYWGNGKSLHIEEVSVKGTNQGIQANMPFTAKAPFISLKGVTVRNCQLHGINIFGYPADGDAITASIDRTASVNNYNGILFYNVRGTVNHSTFSGNANEAVSGDYASVINLENSTIANNSVGIFPSAGSTIRLGANNIHENGTAFFTSGGSKIISFGNNHVMGNAANEVPSSTVSLK